VTHLTGQVLADAIAGTFERFDLFASVKPLVLPGADALATPLVALGVMYYQLRDRL
jgi:gamma-glutamylputrescine oxidase